MQLLTLSPSLFCHLLDFIGFFRLVCLRVCAVFVLSHLFNKKHLKLYLLCIVSFCQLNYLFYIWCSFMVLIFLGLSRVERWRGGDHDGEEGDKSQRRVIVFHGMSWFLKTPWALPNCNYEKSVKLFLSLHLRKLNKSGTFFIT